MATARELIELEYRLIDRFTGVANRIIDAQNRLAHGQSALSAGSIAGASGLGRLALAALGATSPLSALVSVAGTAAATLGGLYTSAVALGATGLGVLGKSAVEAAMHAERMRATFEALLGSRGAAEQAMQFIRDFATTSLFELSQLQEAGTQLAAFGLNIRRTLPLIASLAAAFGPSAENLMMAVSAFGRIGAGQFGEALEILRRFGISAQDLLQAGVNLRITSGGTQVLSSAVEMLNALERIISQRFGGVLQTMQNTAVVALSNMRDALYQVLIPLGEAVLPALTALAQHIVDILNAIRQSGMLQQIAQSWASALQRLEQVTGGVHTVRQVIAAAVALAGVLPDVFANMIAAGKRFAEFLITPFVMIVNLVNRIVDVLQNAMRVLRREPLQWTPMYSPKDIVDNFGAVVGAMFAGVLGGQNAAGRFLELYNQALGAMLAPAGAPAGAGVLGAATQEPWSWRELFTPMSGIEQNTKRIAQNTEALRDFRRLVLGGGELGRYGITPLELRRLQRIRVDTATRDALERAIAQIVYGML